MYDSKSSICFDQQVMNQATNYLRGVISNLQVNYMQPHFCPVRNDKINKARLEDEQMNEIRWGYLTQNSEFYVYAGEAMIKLCNNQEAKNLGLNKPSVVLADLEQQQAIVANISINNQISVDIGNKLLYLIFDQQQLVPAKIQFKTDDQLTQFFNQYQQLLIQQVQQQQFFQDQDDMNYMVQTNRQQSSIQFSDMQASQLFSNQIDYQNFDINNYQVLKSVENKFLLSTQYLDGSGMSQIELAIKDKDKQNFGQKIKLSTDQSHIVALNNQQIGYFDIQQHQLQNIIDLHQRYQQINDYSLFKNQNLNTIMRQEIKPENTLVGISDSNIFMIDKRTPQQQIREITKKTAQKNGEHFDRILTTSNGNVIVTNQQGDISLYNNIEGKRATNVFPGCGQPVNSIWCDDKEQIIVACYRYRIYIHQLISTKGESLFSKTIKKVERQPLKMIIVDQQIMYKYGTNKEIIYAYISHNKIVVGLERAVIVYNLERFQSDNILEYTVKQVYVQDQSIGGGQNNQGNIVATQKHVNCIQL